MAFDQGTSSSKAIIFDEECRTISRTNVEITQRYSKPGWVEQDANEIWNSQLHAAREAIKNAKISIEAISAIGITNQRETIVAWSRNTGKPLYNAISWQCRRTDGICETIRKNEEKKRYVEERTGLVIDPYFSGTKIKWLLDEVPIIREKAIEGELAVGTIDSWLIWKLTKGKVHATDISNASRTMLFDVSMRRGRLAWDADLCDIFSVPIEILPEIKESDSDFGMTEKSVFGTEIPISGVIGDQQGALFGQTCFEKGDTKTTYGTGSFLLMNIGRKFKRGKNILTTVAWKLRGMPVEYAFEGSVFTTGAAVQWLRDGLGIISDLSECERYAREVEDTNGVYFVPALVGLGAPYWDMYARGAIFGLTRGVKKEHIVRAVLESIAYRVKDITDEMEKGGCKLKQMYVDGGGAENDFLMQFQANILDRKVLRTKTMEITGQGAAYLAGVGIGLWTKDELKSLHAVEREYVPSMSRRRREELFFGWKEAVKRAGKWAEIVKADGK
jgi:glycerol kinase